MKKIITMMAIAMAIVACATDAQAGWRRNNSCSNGSCSVSPQFVQSTPPPQTQVINTPQTQVTQCSATTITSTTCATTGNRRRARGCR